MKKLFPLLSILLIAVFVLSACATEAQEEPSATVDSGNSEEVADQAPESESADEADEPAEATEPDVILDEYTALRVEFSWDEDYITEIPPIMMREPFYEIFGQSNGYVPYIYEIAVKHAGHSSAATAGAWELTRKALEVLYPYGEIPVRGQIEVQAPGAEAQFPVGVFGEVITYITGASPKTGFFGAEFGKANDLFNRQNLMTYTDEPTNTPPPKMEWIFTRKDNDAKVGVTMNITSVQPFQDTNEFEMGAKMAKGATTPEEAEEYYLFWNDRARFVFDNADTLDGFFYVNVYEEAPITTGIAIEDVEGPNPDDFAWTQEYTTTQEPIWMIDPYAQIFGQAQGPIPYYYDEVIQVAGHSCGATTGAWTITQLALEALYPDGETPVRGMIQVNAPGSEAEFPVGVFGEIISYITGAAPHTGFVGQQFGKADPVFNRQNKMVYMEEKSGTPPPMMEWVFTRLDTGVSVGVKFNLVLITPIHHPGAIKMGKSLAAYEPVTAEDKLEYFNHWNDRAIFVIENKDNTSIFKVNIIE